MKKLAKMSCLFMMVLAVMAGMGCAMVSADVVEPQTTEVTVAPEKGAAAVKETVPAETKPEDIKNVDAASSADSVKPAETEAAPQEKAVEETVPAQTGPEVEMIPSLEDLAQMGTDTYKTVPLYFQTDYPNNMYGGGSIANNGCSVTCLAMVASYMTNHEYLPDELARYFGGVAENNIERLEMGADAMQLPWEEMENFHRAIEALREGKLVIALMDSNSIFTDTQHFIVLTGYNEDGLIVVHDPYEPNYDKWDLKRAFREGFTEGDICCGFNGAWAFDVDAMPEEPFLYHEEWLGGEPRYPDIVLSESDIQLFASVIWAEARGECEEGQQAVAEVILNRLASEDFPNTMTGVVYAGGQFRSVDVLEEAEPHQAQYEAIDRAIFGPYILPENVMHFATFPTNDNVWGEIGGHIFCYQY